MSGERKTPGRPTTLQTLEPRLLMAGDVVYALNAGGPGFTDSNGVVWVNDTPFANNDQAFAYTFSTSDPIDLSHPSLPDGTAAQLFQSERFDVNIGEPLTYRFDVENGDYQVDLYFADIFSGTQGVGDRVFDINLEGQTAFDDFDAVAAAGAGLKGVVQSFTVAVEDGELEVEFIHQIENPAVKAILVRTVEIDPPDPIAPELDLNGPAAGTGSSATFVAGDGPVRIAPGFTAVLTDADSQTIESVTLTLNSRPDGDAETLEVDLANYPGITSSYVDGVLTLSGSDSPADYASALGLVTYNNTAATPTTADRTIAVVANDGALDSNVATATVNIEIPTPDPIAPALDLNGPAAGTNSVAAFTAGDSPVDIAPDATLSDADSSLSSLTVSLANTPDGNAEALDADVAGTGLIKSYANGTLTLSGVASAAVYQAVLRTVTYDNTAEPADATPRTINVVANDGLLDSNPASVTLAVDNPVPDPIAPALDLNGSAAGTGSTATHVIAQGPTAITSPDAVLTDADSATLESLTVTITNQNSTGEYLDADVTGTAINKVYLNGNGQLRLTGTASVAEYQAVLRTVTYENLFPTPDLTTRNIAFVANDGVLDSAAAVASVAIEQPAVDPTPPVVDLNGPADGTGSTAAFVAGEGPVRIAGLDATVNDADTAALRSLTVTITNLQDTNQEVLSADTTGTPIQRSYSFAGVLTLSGFASSTQFQSVLRAVTYNNLAANPDTSTRLLEVVASDGELVSTPAVASVTVEASPDPIAPTLDLNGNGPGNNAAATFVVGGDPVALAPAADLADADSATLSSLTVSLAATPDGADETLDANVAGTGIAKAYGNGVLMLTGVAAIADYQAVLRSVTYTNAAATPDDSARTLTVVANDGDVDSNAATVFLEIDLPTAGPGEVLYALNAGGSGFTDSNGVTWVNDTPFTNNEQAFSFTFSTSSAIDVSHPSVPAGTNAQLFQSERFDAGIGQEMAYTFDVDAGNYQVDLYFADTFSGTQDVGDRVFDIVLEGQTVFDDFDTVAAAGQGFRGVVQSFTVNVTDGQLDLEFLHEVENPAIKGILVRSLAAVTPDPVAPALDLDAAAPGSNSTATFVAGEGPVGVVAPDALLIDADSAALQSLSVFLVDTPDGASERLDADVAGTGISKSFAGGVLSLTGVASVADYQVVLRTVTYDNLAANPTLAVRSINFTANDGTLDSNTAIASVTVRDDSVQPGTLVADVATTLDFDNAQVGVVERLTVTLTHPGNPGDTPVTVTGTDFGGLNQADFGDLFAQQYGDSVTVNPGQSIELTFYALPQTTGAKTASVTIAHSGTNTLTFNLEANAVDPVDPAFNTSFIAGLEVTRPTTLQWGPDNRLYVGTLNGQVLVYTIERNGPNDYAVTDTQVITAVQDIPNHNDDGTPNPDVDTRLITGLKVAGTASAPILYVTSSDPRLTNDAGNATDTNSGVVSQLTPDGNGGWDKVDLVRGLPRSSVDHALHGLQLLEDANTLLVAVGGLTNAGAPGEFFGNLPEYALSAAIVSLDLDALNALPNQTDGNGQQFKHNLPTLNDEDRPGTNDAGDPFGGNAGKNQAVLEADGPVDIFASGLRNPYDFVVTQYGLVYSTDNGPNASLGDEPAVDSNGNPTNDPNPGGSSAKDALHLVSEGSYSGHPNPTRANTDNTFNPTNPQSPVYDAYTEPGTYTANGDDDALALFDSSTNGITEYTATGFGGALNGDLLTVSITGQLTRLKLSPDGTSVIDREILFNDAGAYPLDVTAVGDDHPFAGTIWVTDLFTGPGQAIRVYEPEVGTGQGTPEDLDGDGYLNQDEIDNGTNPESAGDTPTDNDLDFVSDLNDPDDDNDALADLNDPFQVDFTNGSGVNAPFALTFDNDDLNRGGLLDLGFTGVMTNGTTDYRDQFDFANLTAGSAAGVLTIDAVGPGTALGSTNTQENAFQFGLNLDPASQPVTIQTKIDSVFDNATPAAGQRAGLYFGTGDQDNYIAVFIEGDGTINTVTEIEGVPTFGTGDVVGSNFTNLNLYLTVDPATQTVQAAYSYGNGPITELAGAAAFPLSWLEADTAPAVGVIATSGDSGEAYSVTYDFIRIEPAAGIDGQAPFDNTPQRAGERVEAEEFDLGGDGVAYLDLTSFNQGPSDFRPGEFVDLEPTNDVDGGLNVGWIEAGEWLEYTFDLDEAGIYSADFRVALAGGDGGSFHLEINGQNISGPVDLPNTGGWQNWQTVTANDLQLEEGPAVLRVVFDTPSAGSFVGNLNWLQLNLEQSSQGNPPTVAAGPDQSFAGPAGSVALDATVTDDSTNDVPLRTYWNLVTGPAAVAFDDPYAVDTNVSFTQPGVYVLRLSADNGLGGVVSDDIRVTVNPANSGIVFGVDLLDESNGDNLGGLATNPLDPGDIVWNTILIDESQVNNFPGSADGSTDSPATGSATFSYDASTNELSYEITYAGLTADLTNIHIHGPASAGVSNMAHIFDVFSGEQDVIDAGIDRRNATVTGLVNLTSHTHGGNNPTPTLAEALEALTTGQAYVNVHTTAFPMGEIRGNVPVAVPAEDPFFDLGAINATTVRFTPTTTGGVDAVRYFLDGVELVPGNGPSREVTWQATTGDHVLVAIPNDGQNDGPASTFKFSVRADPGETRLAEWQQIANAPFAQFEGQGVEAGGKLYLFGGFKNGALQVTDQFAVYDPATNEWTELTDAPLQLTHAHHVADGENIYVLGGYVGTHPGGSTDAVWVYNIPTNTWSAGPSLPEDRAGGGAAILGRTLYYFSGATRTQGNVGSTVDHPDLWALDLGATSSTSDDAATWTTGLADMPDPRNHMAGVALDGYVYAIGGQDRENEFTGNSDRVHRYDPTTDTWTRVADLPIEIGHITASTFAANGRIFVVTGVTQNSVSTDTVFMYDPATDTWTSLPPAPIPAQSPIAVHIDGKIYVVGGDEVPGGITSKAYVTDLDEAWFALDSAPVALGEVAAGVIGNTLYVVGESNNATLAYNIATGEWSGTNDLAQRPLAGNHHAAEVIDGKLYLFGGLGANSDGRVQIYDPVADAWSFGADLPFDAGSSATALIDGKVYLASGIIGNATTQQAAVYDPVLDSWTSIASIPDDANHAAAATDGSKFYVFGGRTGGNVVGDGFDTVQVYDPLTDTWDSSSDPGSTLAPMPEARGGTGKAVFLNGEFYVFGGETLTSAAANASGVYDRVDIYNPVTNTWRLGTPMPTARHGIFPVEHAGVIYVAAGGVQAGGSASNLLEAYYVDVI